MIKTTLSVNNRFQKGQPTGKILQKIKRSFLVQFYEFCFMTTILKINKNLFFLDKVFNSWEIGSPYFRELNFILFQYNRLLKRWIFMVVLIVWSVFEEVLFYNCLFGLIAQINFLNKLINWNQIFKTSGIIMVFFYKQNFLFSALVLRIQLLTMLMTNEGVFFRSNEYSWCAYSMN